MQEENQLAVAAEPPQTPDPPVIEQEQPEDGEALEQQTQEHTPQQPQVSPETEASAIRMGWKPLSQWRGDPKNWRPADEFVRRGEEFLPIVNSRAQKAEAEVANLRGQLAERDRDYEARFQQLARTSQLALERQAQQIGQHYQAQMREAVRRGDEEGWDALNRQYANEIGDLNKRAAEAYHPPQPTQQELQRQQELLRQQAEADPQYQQAQKTVQQWIGRQGWWHRDAEMREAAKNYHGFLQQTQPMPIEDNLAEVEHYLQTEFPDKFKARAPANGAGQRQQQHAPPVEGGGRQPAGSGRVKGWNELPPEAKKAGEGFIGQELYTNDAKGRAEYASDYWAQE